MFPIYRAIKSSKKKKCFIYKKKDGSEKEIDLKFHRSFFLFRYVNNRVPESSFSLIQTTFSDEQMRIIYKCVLYSYMAYKDRSIIDFPPEVNLEFEKLDSDVNRIPFFIVTDSTINAIVLGCRGSSCLDDFITDSLGNGVSYDGGKFHQGVFSTASYVFMQCQSKLIELNELLNNSSNQESDDEDTNNDQPEIDYISSSEFVDYSEDESEDSDDNRNEDNSNEDSQPKPELKPKSSFNVHHGHKSDSNEKLSSNKNENEMKHESTSNMSSSSSNEKLSQSQKSKIYKKMMKTPTKIIITGHSLGAAVAAVVTYLFREKFPELDVQCICFAPPPTLTLNLWQTTDSYIKSFMIEGDPVPFLSVQNLITISDYLFKLEHTNKIFKKLIHKYLNKKSFEEFEANSAMKEPLYPPGRYFLIRFTNDDDKTLIEKQKLHIKKKKEEIKKKLTDLKQKAKQKIDKIKKKDGNTDKDEESNYLEEEDEKVEIKDEQIQVCRVPNPEYFTNFVNNVSENNHFIKNYTKLMIRMLNKSIKKEIHKE